MKINSQANKGTEKQQQNNTRNTNNLLLPYVATPFDRRVVGSNPALAAMYRDLGQVLYLQFPVALRRVNSDTV